MIFKNKIIKMFIKVSELAILDLILVGWVHILTRISDMGNIEYFFRYTLLMYLTLMNSFIIKDYLMKYAEGHDVKLSQLIFKRVNMKKSVISLIFSIFFIGLTMLIIMPYFNSEITLSQKGIYSIFVFIVISLIAGGYLFLRYSFYSILYLEDSSWSSFSLALKKSWFSMKGKRVRLLMLDIILIASLFVIGNFIEGVIVTLIILPTIANVLTLGFFSIVFLIIGCLCLWILSISLTLAKEMIYLNFFIKKEKP